MRSTRDADGAAVELAAELIFLTGFAADAYVQAPPRWTGETDLGFGAAAVAGAFAGPIVYVQAGPQNLGRLLRVHDAGRRTIHPPIESATGDNGPAMSWQPTIAIEPLETSSRIRYFFVSATIGRTFNGCIQVFLGCNESSRASIAVGVAMSRPPAPASIDISQRVSAVCRALESIAHAGPFVARRNSLDDDHIAAGVVERVERVVQPARVRRPQSVGMRRDDRAAPRASSAPITQRADR